MGISDKNEIIYLAYDSVVEYESVDYTVIARSNISNPVLSYLLYDLDCKGARKYLWYDKKEHKIALMDMKKDASGFVQASYRLILSDNFQRQSEKKEGAPQLYPAAYDIFMSADGNSIAVCESLNGNKTLYEGVFVKPSRLNIYPYSS
jgi:hypothetical protein